jgi:hypothetical protein
MITGDVNTRLGIMFVTATRHLLSLRAGETAVESKMDLSKVKLSP